LTSIKAYAELLQQGTGDMSEEVRSEFLKVIHKESDKLTGIVDDLLELSRMEGGRAHVDRPEGDLAAVVHRLEESARTRAAEQGIAFTVDLPPGKIPLRLDAMLLQQMLDHLLSNAFKFTPAGGAVGVILHDRPTQVEIVVEDTGIGIPEEQMDYIFDRFYQADGSATREHGGQGIGLAICHDIVRYHEGRIWAENVHPHGARFRVVLPRRGRVIQKMRQERADTGSVEPHEFLEKLTHWISETLEVEVVSLMVPDEDGEHLEILAAVGLPESIVQNTRLHKGAGIAGKVWASGRSLFVPDVTADARLGKRANHARYTTPSLLSVPLLADLDVIGVVNVNNRRDGHSLTPSDRLLLEALASRVSYLLSQYQAHRDNLQHFAGLQEAMRATIAVRRGRYNELTLACHRICLAAARRLKLPPAELEHLTFALQHYDVGLDRVSGQLLGKRRQLTAEEREEIRKHVPAGLDILAPLRVSPKVRQIILHHHERHDGGGYPDGLEGEAIPIGARLLALTDSFHAMLQDRPHRPRRSFTVAVAEIESLAGTQYCPRLTVPFLAEAQAHREEIETLQRASAGGEASIPQRSSSAPTDAETLSVSPVTASRDPAAGR
jgi:response regulator RpfG family c-di-GMP phosphodiesterase